MQPTFCCSVTIEITQIIPSFITGPQYPYISINVNGIGSWVKNVQISKGPGTFTHLEYSPHISPRSPKQFWSVTIEITKIRPYFIRGPQNPYMSIYVNRIGSWVKKGQISRGPGTFSHLQYLPHISPRSPKQFWSVTIEITKIIPSFITGPPKPIYISIYANRIGSWVKNLKGPISRGPGTFSHLEYLPHISPRSPKQFWSVTIEITKIRPSF